MWSQLSTLEYSAHSGPSSVMLQETCLGMLDPILLESELTRIGGGGGGTNVVGALCFGLCSTGLRPWTLPWASGTSCLDECTL